MGLVEAKLYRSVEGKREGFRKIIFKTGTTFASFHAAGNLPVEKDTIIKIRQRGYDIDGASFFRTSFVIVSKLGLRRDFSRAIAFLTSTVAVID